MELIIEKTTPKYVEQIKEKLYKIQELHLDNRPDTFKKKMDIEDEFALSSVLCRDGDKVIGFAGYTIIRDGKEEMAVYFKPYMYINGVYIEKEYRNNKYLAHKLKDEFKKIAKQNNIDRLELRIWDFNQIARASAEKMGFKEKCRYYELYI